jgi:hypothetical protein
MSAAQTIYMVQRRPCQAPDGWIRFEEAREPYGVPVAAFRERSLADEYRLEMERVARRDLSPFELGPIHDLTSLSEVHLADRILALGLRPPNVKERERYHGYWARWWDRTAGRLTEEQREAIWNLMDRLSLYFVLPLDLED